MSLLKMNLSEAFQADCTKPQSNKMVFKCLRSRVKERVAKQVIAECCICITSVKQSIEANVLRSAALLIGRRVSKFDHVSAYMWDVLHWLPLR